LPDRGEFLEFLGLTPAAGAFVLFVVQDGRDHALVGGPLRIAEWERIPPGDLMSWVTSDTTLLRAVSPC
jgi:hypothetical protein